MHELRVGSCGRGCNGRPAAQDASRRRCVPAVMLTLAVKIPLPSNLRPCRRRHAIPEHGTLSCCHSAPGRAMHACTTSAWFRTSHRTLASLPSRRNRRSEVHTRSHTKPVSPPMSSAPLRVQTWGHARRWLGCAKAGGVAATRRSCAVSVHSSCPCLSVSKGWRERALRIPFTTTIGTATTAAANGCQSGILDLVRRTRVQPKDPCDCD
jgi:hypothetical protein